MSHEAKRGAAWIVALLLASAGAARAVEDAERTGGPYVPTPQVVVDQMLRMANVGPKDYVMDLGAGDGVIVLTAARQFQARGLGVDIDPDLVKRANAEAAKLGIADRARFAVMDVFKADLSRATVVTLYLLPAMMIDLRPKIFNELKPGTRVVSHDYHFEDWRADDSVTFDVPEKEGINGVPKATVWLWIIPARIGGRWQLAVDGGATYDVTWRQNYQVVDGAATAGGHSYKLREASLRGTGIAFDLAGQSFAGKVSGGTMTGTVELSRGKTARWTATRVPAGDGKALSVQ